MYECAYMLLTQWRCFESAADLPPIFSEGTRLLSMAVLVGRTRFRMNSSDTESGTRVMILYVEEQRADDAQH